MLYNGFVAMDTKFNNQWVRIPHISVQSVVNVSNSVSAKETFNCSDHLPLMLFITMIQGKDNIFHIHSMHGRRVLYGAGPYIIGVKQAFSSEQLSSYSQWSSMWHTNTYRAPLCAYQI